MNVLAAVDGIDHVIALGDRLAIYAKSLRKNIEKTNNLGDMDTNDLFIEISRAIDKRLWFLEAHLQTSFQNQDRADQTRAVIDEE